MTSVFENAKEICYKNCNGMPRESHAKARMALRRDGVLPKSELGLRPVFHTKDDPSDGHLYIAVLAYQCVQVLRWRLKAAGINDAWATLRATLSVKRRVAATYVARMGARSMCANARGQASQPTRLKRTLRRQPKSVGGN